MDFGASQAKPSSFPLANRILGMSALSQCDLTNKFRQADSDGSGGIDFDEFCGEWRGYLVVVAEVAAVVGGAGGSPGG
jgi:hypothetical protein